jgi:hypothetical protein
MISEFTVQTQFVVLTCCVQSCSMSFGVPAQWKQWRKTDHAFFYCPNGHQQHFPPSEEEREAMRRQQEERRLAAQEREAQWERERQARLEARQQRQADLRDNAAYLHAQHTRVASALRRNGIDSHEKLQEFLKHWEHSDPGPGDGTGLRNVGRVGLNMLRQAVADNDAVFFGLLGLDVPEPERNGQA